MKNKGKYSLILLIALLAMIFSNPSQEDYQERLSIDFGAFHGGMQLSAEQIVAMGHGNRNSYLLFSTYQFQLGTIGVQYWGIAGMTFFSRSFKKDDTRTKNKAVSI